MSDINRSKIIEFIRNIEEWCTAIRIVLDTPSGIEIKVIYNDSSSYVHYWDGRNPLPRIFLQEDKKVTKKEIVEQACVALNLLTPYAFDVGVKWTGDLPWEELPEQFQKLHDVFQIEKT